MATTTGRRWCNENQARTVPSSRANLHQVRRGDNMTLNNVIRGWVSDGCPPTTLFRDGDFYYVSAHTDKGLSGGKVTDLRFDEWGEHTPQSDADADWIATQITEKIETMTIINELVNLNKVSNCCSAELYEYHPDDIYARCKSCGEMAEVVERE